MVFYPISEISSKHDVILIYFPPSTLPTYYNRVMLHLLNPLMGDREKRLTNGHGKSPNIKSPLNIAYLLYYVWQKWPSEVWAKYGFRACGLYPESLRPQVYLVSFHEFSIKCPLYCIPIYHKSPRLR